MFARKTLVIGTGYEAARLGKISNNNRFSLTQVEGYVDANWTDQLFDFKQENVIKIVLFIVMKNWMRLLKL